MKRKKKQNKNPTLKRCLEFSSCIHYLYKGINVHLYSFQACPRFGQDRVNFHRNPGRDTVRQADPHLAKQSRVFHTMCLILGSGGWSWAVGTHSRPGSAQRWERLFGLCGLRCVFPLSVLLLFLFPLFAVLLNCPYPDPPVSACFFPFSSAPWRGEGRPRGALVAKP